MSDAAVGVRELLIDDRDPWTLQLFRLERRRVVSVEQWTIEEPVVLASQVLPFRFRLVPGNPGPQIEVLQRDSRQ